MNVYVFANQGSGGNAFFSPALPSGVLEDNQVPIIPGTLSISDVTAQGCVISWSPASDNIGVTGYEVSADTGTPSYAPVGMVLTKLVAGLNPSTEYTVRVRAFDQVNNKSIPLTATFTTTEQPVGNVVVVINKQSNSIPVQALSALGTSASTLDYKPNTGQELVLFNRSNSPVVVNMKGSSAGVISVKGAITKLLDLSGGLNITAAPNTFTTLKLDNAVLYLAGNVTVVAGTSGVVFAGVLQ